LMTVERERQIAADAEAAEKLAASKDAAQPAPAAAVSQESEAAEPTIAQ
jgi:large subunit ribosomal protein L29